MLDELEGFWGGDGLSYRMSSPSSLSHKRTQTRRLLIAAHFRTSTTPHRTRQTEHIRFLILICAGHGEWPYFQHPKSSHKTEILMGTPSFATGGAVALYYFFPRQFSSRKKLTWAFPNLISYPGVAAIFARIIPQNGLLLFIRSWSRYPKDACPRELDRKLWQLPTAKSKREEAKTGNRVTTDVKTSIGARLSCGHHIGRPKHHHNAMATSQKSRIKDTKRVDKTGFWPMGQGSSKQASWWVQLASRFICLSDMRRERTMNCWKTRTRTTGVAETWCMWFKSPRTMFWVPHVRFG